MGGLVGLFFIAGAAYVYESTATAEIGFRGVGMQITDSNERLDAKLAANVMPPALPPAADSGVLAVNAYENVHVLGHLTTAEFTRLMTAITIWVAPQQGCAYCHNANNLASDEVYTKIVARRMLQMTMHINENWQAHVQETGVTCYTCHRGQPVPAHIWFNEPPQDNGGMVGNRAHQNRASANVGLTSLPGNVFETFLNGETNIRVQGGTALPTGNRSSIKQGEWTYGLMMHFSNSLGVNCTFCHNSRSWADWSQSPAQRGTAWYGIRMVRDVNQEYLESITDVFPAHRLGELGDVAKVNCASCHQGAYQPLLGQSMLADYPSLARAMPQPERTVEEPVEEEPEPPPIDAVPAEGAEATETGELPEGAAGTESSPGAGATEQAPAGVGTEAEATDEAAPVDTAAPPVAP